MGKILALRLGVIPPDAYFCNLDLLKPKKNTKLPNQGIIKCILIIFEWLKSKCIVNFDVPLWRLIAERGHPKKRGCPFGHRLS